MNKWHYKLLEFIRLFVFITARETNMGEAQHIFLEAYDTYVKAGQVPLADVAGMQQRQGTCVLCPL